MPAQEYADSEKRCWDRRNVAHRSKFMDSDVPLPHIPADPDLAYAWALDRSVMTSETAKHRLRCVDGKMARYSDEWSLAVIAATALSPAHVLGGRGRTAHGVG